MQKNSRHLNNKGQVLPYFLIMSIVLLISWAMMVNIAKVLRDRMMLQNSVDNTVLSIGNLQARTLNLLGAANHLMATILSTASYPSIAMFPTFSTDKVAGSMIPGPFCDYYCSGSSGIKITEKYTGVLKMKKTVNMIQKFQDLLLTNYAVNYALLLKQIPQKGHTVVVVPSRFAKKVSFSALKITDPKVLLGIKRNTKGITYYKTANYCIDLKAKHYHLVLPKLYTNDKVSWYVQDENFYDKKLVAFGIKDSSSEKNSLYPLFGGIFNVKMPNLYAVGAAGLYNIKGAMFPEKEDTGTGLSYITAAIMSPMVINQLFVFYNVIEAVSTIPVLGQLCAVVGIAYATYYAEEASRKIITEPDNKNTPIYQYNQAELGGWDAHLVPLSQ